MSIGLLGKKIGMTRIYDETGKAQPVTVIEAGGNEIAQVKTAENDGYTAVQVAFDDQKKQRLTKAVAGHLAKHGASPKKRIREFRLEEGETVPDEKKLSVALFQEGQYVDVIGRSKGRGFQGVMKRHGFAGQPDSHGSKMHRRPGSIGAGSTPGHPRKGQPMPGHMGDRRVTTQNLRVLQVREADGVLLISGAIPGAKGSYVVIRPSKKKTTPAKEA